MKKLFYYVARIFFSKEKLLLIKLLNEIQDSLFRYPDGSVKMKYGGMCYYIDSKVISNYKEYTLLKNILYENRPENTKDEGYFFKPYSYEPRFEFLKELIKKY